MTFGAQQPSGLEVPLDGTPVPPQTHAVHAELADDVSRADLAVAQNGVAERGRADEFHEYVGAPFALVGAEGGQERGDFGAVDVVPAALALGLEHVGGCAGGVDGERDGVFPLRGGVEGVDGREGGADAGQEGGVGR